MDSTSAKRARRAQVQIDVVGASFILTVGSVSLLLDRDAVEEIMCVIADSLEKIDPLDLSPPESN